MSTFAQPTAPSPGSRWERVPARPLSPAGERVLAALAELCPGAGQESTTRAIAEAVELKPGATKLVLQGLARRKLAFAYEGDTVWSPTVSGRQWAAEVRAAA